MLGIVVHPEFGAMPMDRYDAFMREAISRRWDGMRARLRQAELLTTDEHDPGDEDRSES